MPTPNSKVNIQLEAAIRALLFDQPIAYHPILAHVSGSVTAGLLLSQFLYWTPRAYDRDGWLWKTQEQIQEETGLTRREQETARRHLTSIGVVHEERRGVPAKLYFQVDIRKLTELLASPQYGAFRHSRMADSAIQEWRIPPDKNGGNMQSNTEITSETTSEITSSNSKGSAKSKNTAAPEEQQTSGFTPVQDIIRRRGRPPGSKNRPNSVFDEAIRQLSEEFGDAKHFRSNLSQSHHLLTESGLDESSFLTVCYEARSVVRQEHGVRNRMAYFYEVIRGKLAKDNEPDRISYERRVLR